jgi:bifunctional DNA-binding transcriptional regulator/antitoxin component of YhaV-PrlF toxin-antitoxin module
MQESKVTAKGQSTLPQDARAALGLEAGDSVRYIVEDVGVEFTPLYVSDVCSIIKNYVTDPMVSKF